MNKHLKGVLLLLLLMAGGILRAQEVPCNPANPIPASPASNGFRAAFLASATNQPDSTCDDCFRLFELPFAFTFSGKSYRNVYLNNNGCISFTAGIETWIGQHFPISPTLGPIIAAWWGDVDTRFQGSMATSYKMTADSFIVIWNKVRAYPTSDTSTCTFRMTITDNSGPNTTGNDVIFSYGHLGWLQGTAGNSRPPQAGFDAGDGQNFYDVPQSQDSSMRNLRDKCLAFKAENLLYVGDVASNTLVNLNQGESKSISPSFYLATSASVNTSGLCGVAVGTFNTATGAQPITITGQLCNTGAHDIVVTSTVGSTVYRHTVRVNVLPPAPVISYPDSLLFLTGVATSTITPTNTGGPIPANAYGQVSTLAGSGVAGFSNLKGTQAAFNSPGQLTTDLFGNVYVRDFNNNKIRKITQTGDVSDFGSIPRVDAGIYADADGKLYVPSNDSVRIYSPTGQLLFVHTGMDVTPGETLHSFVIDSSGRRTFATSFTNSRINRGTPTGNPNNTYGAVVNSVFSGTGTPGSTNGTTNAQFNKPAQMVIDRFDNLFVVDNNGTSIRKVTPGGVVSTVVSNPTSKFVGLCVSVAGDLFVTNASNARVNRILPNGSLEPVAGGAALPVDGIGTSAGFKKPVGIAIDFDGNLFVSDSGDHRIRRVVTTGYTISPALPTGLVLNTATGAISGTPTIMSAATKYVVTGYNLQGKSTDTITIAVDSLVITRTPACTNGSPTTLSIRKTGGPSTENYNWHQSSCSGVLVQSTPSITLTPVTDTVVYVRPALRPSLNCNAIPVPRSTAVAITTQPQTTINNCMVNGVAIAPVISVTAVNAIRYQWRKGTTPIPGATGKTYALPATATTDAGVYRVMVYGVCDSVLSGTSIYTIGTQALVSREAVSDSLCTGGAMSINIIAANATAYQWQLNGANISSATNPVYSKTNVTVADSGIYRVIVSGTNGCNDTTYSYVGVRSDLTASITATLTNSGPVCAGNELTLTATPTYTNTGPRGMAARMTTINVTNDVGSATTIRNNFSYDFWARPTKARTSRAESRTTAVSDAGQSFATYPPSTSATNSNIGVSVGNNGVSVTERLSTASGQFFLLNYDTTITAWTHIAVVVTGMTPALYIDGTLRRTGLLSTATANIGASLGSFGVGGTTWYQGDIDNIRIWSGSIPAASIPTIRQSQTVTSVSGVSAVARYTFDSTNTTSITTYRAWAAPSSYIKIDSGYAGYRWKPLTQLATLPFSDTSSTQQTIAPLTSGTYQYALSAEAGGCASYIGTTSVTVTARGTNPVTASASDTVYQPDASTVYYADASCNPIASIIDPIGGITMGKTSCALIRDASVQTFQSQAYLQRHFDIAPTTNGPAYVQLYLTQADFNSYNTWLTTNRPTWPKAPTGPSDAAGIANLAITQYHGLPSSGTTGPGGRYNAANKNLIGSDQLSVSWNGNYWIIGVPVSSFSGFYISTPSFTPLPVKLEDINATNVGAANIITWKAVSETASDRYLLQRSADGKDFSTIHNRAASGKGGTYIYRDEEPLAGRNYYRLEMEDAGGNKSYSKTVSAIVREGGATIAIYPNPTTGLVSLKRTSGSNQQGMITITDVTGKVLFTQTIISNDTDIDLTKFATGIYFLEYQDGSGKQVIRLSKL